MNVMRHNRLFTILLAAACATAVLAAPATYHRLGVCFAGGYTTHTFSDHNPRTQGATIAFGGVYELEHRHFLFQTALSAYYDYMHYTFADQQVDLPNVVDDEGETAMMHYKWTRIRANDHLALPALALMMGGGWEHFYFLLGANVGVGVFSRQNYEAAYTITATYPFFDTELGNMPQHGLVSDVPLSGKQSLGMTVQSRLMGEIGVPVQLRNGVLRLGLFGQYALPASGEQTQVVIDDINALKASMCHFLQRSPYVRFSTGIRLTLLFNVKSKSGHNHKCMCMP